MIYIHIWDSTSNGVLIDRKCGVYCPQKASNVCYGALPIWEENNLSPDSVPSKLRLPTIEVLSVCIGYPSPNNSSLLENSVKSWLQMTELAVFCWKQTSISFVQDWTLENWRLLKFSLFFIYETKSMWGEFRIMLNRAWMAEGRQLSLTTRSDFFFRPWQSF